MTANRPSLLWLEPGEPFPDVSSAWNDRSPAPGLLAAGADLEPTTLQQAYRHGIFPWFSDGQPILWWSPDPRMVLKVHDFRIHPSFRKTLKSFSRNPRHCIRIDSAFADVIHQCANSQRRGAPGTWIVPQMQQAYTQLHHLGYAHSVETWMDGELVGGLYCVAIGGAVFGESMFSTQPNASKLALAALVALCRHHAVPQIDCQQNTSHLSSLGAREVPRQDFLDVVAGALEFSPFDWEFDPLYWNPLLHPDALT